MKDYPLINLAAGAEEEIGGITGSNFVYCDDASGSFQIRVDNNPYLAFFEGREYTHKEGAIKRLYVKNTGGAPLTMNLIVGENNVKDNVTTLTGEVDISAADGVRDTADVSLPAAATTLVIAAAADRTHLLLVNAITNTKTFRIGFSTAGAARGPELPPGANITLPTKGAVYAYNPAGAVENIQVLELYKT